MTESLFNGPFWLINQDELLEDITINSSPESENQRKMIKEVLSAAVIQNSSLSFINPEIQFSKNNENHGMVSLIY